MENMWLAPLLPGVDSSQLRDGPYGCGGVVHDEPGDHGGCGCAVSGFGGHQGWLCAPDPRRTSSSSGLGCCWLASGPCWTALPHSQSTQPGNKNDMSAQTKGGTQDSSQRRGFRRGGRWGKVMWVTVNTKTMTVILEMKRLPLTHFIWSRTELLEWCVIAVVWMRVCLRRDKGGFTQDEGWQKRPHPPKSSGAKSLKVDAWQHNEVLHAGIKS